MKKYSKNATDLLKELMTQRNWHQGKIERRKAAMYKIGANNNTLSYEKASELLELLGWQKIKEEVWQNENQL